MADVKMIATRESYGNTLKALAAEGHDDLVVLDADLAAATKTGMFRKAHPDRHFDCGIAEANMMGVAAGLSTMGYVPFVSSFAMFAAGRAFEQIRNSVAYPHLNVKIGATHGGISVGEDGASHQCCEDFALMRSLPGMTIICPADDVEARAAVRAAYEMQGPVYLRFGRLAVPVFHDEANYHFEIGKGEQLTEGSDIAIVATGLMVNEARKAAEKISEGSFGLDDFLDQLQQVRKLGPMKNLLGMIPGMAAHRKELEQFDEREIDRTEAIIRSMTPAERRDPSIIDGSRRARIAYGSGVTVSQVNALLQRFDQAAKMMRRMSNKVGAGVPGFGGPAMGGGKGKGKGKKSKKKSKSGNPMKREAEEKALRNKLAGKSSNGKSSGGSAFAKKPQNPALPAGLQDMMGDAGELPPNFGGGLSGLLH